MVVGRIGEMNRECCNCGSLLGDVVSEDSPSTFGCGQITATPILINLVNGFVVGTTIAFCTNTEFHSIWTYNNNLIE